MVNAASTRCQLSNSFALRLSLRLPLPPLFILSYLSAVFFPKEFVSTGSVSPFAPAKVLKSLVSSRIFVISLCLPLFLFWLSLIRGMFQMGSSPVRSRFLSQPRSCEGVQIKSESADWSSGGAMLCLCVLYLFHLRFGPDEKEKLRSALFPNVPTVLELPLPLCGDWLTDPASFSLFHLNSFPLSLIRCRTSSFLYSCFQS